MNHKHKTDAPAPYPVLSKQDYKSALKEVQIELVKLQRRLIANGERVLMIVEGRDAAGKDGLIKRLTAHMSPRETRIFAVAKPSNREETEWYFQRFVSELPAAGEFVVFNRSWYNRAGVEHVMGFCSKTAYQQFMSSVADFETLLVRDGIILLKYYLDISRATQKQRLAERIDDPLTQWKVSPIDEAAQQHWKDYSHARDAMFRQTSHKAAPWIVVRADDKRTARVEAIRDLLHRLEYQNKSAELRPPDRQIVFEFSEAAIADGLIVE